MYWKRTYAWRDPAPSAVLRIGQSDVYPYYSVFHGVEEQVLHYAAEIKNPVHLLIGKLDASFLAIYVLPLILITLVYDLLSAERESGRLALVQGHGTSLVSWLTSRLALRWLLVVGWFAVCLVAALAATEPAVLATPAVLQFVGLVALYLAFWGGLALAINMRGWSSAVNALGLAASWIVFVFAYPTLVDSVASTVYGVPSRNQQALEDMRVRAEVDADRPRYLEQYLRDRPELRVQAPTERRPVQVYDWYPAFLTYQIAVDELTAGTEHAIREELMARGAARSAAPLRLAGARPARRDRSAGWCRRGRYARVRRPGRCLSGCLARDHPGVSLQERIPRCRGLRSAARIRCIRSSAHRPPLARVLRGPGLAGSALHWSGLGGCTTSAPTATRTRLKSFIACCGSPVASSGRSS